MSTAGKSLENASSAAFGTDEGGTHFGGAIPGVLSDDGVVAEDCSRLIHGDPGVHLPRKIPRQQLQRIVDHVLVGVAIDVEGTGGDGEGVLLRPHGAVGECAHGNGRGGCRDEAGGFGIRDGRGKVLGHGEFLSLFFHIAPLDAVHETADEKRAQSLQDSAGHILGPEGGKAVEIEGSSRSEDRDVQGVEIEHDPDAHVLSHLSRFRGGEKLEKPFLHGEFHVEADFFRHAQALAGSGDEALRGEKACQMLGNA
nr:hypothetical protein [Aminiphilus sp.]